jgi:hypothetical protein
MDYDKIACIYQLALQIYNLSHVASHVRDAMYFCANDKIHHYKPACDWLKAHEEETTEDAHVNQETATQIYYICQSIINTWPYAKLVLTAIEYCALCKCAPAIHWCTGYWTCYISCVMSDQDSELCAGDKIYYDLLKGSNHKHQILQNLLAQVIEGKTQKVNGFPNELPERADCPFYNEDETGKACTYGMTEFWGEEPEMCGYDHGDASKKGDGNILKCDLLDGWLSPDFKTFPLDLVSLNKTYSSKDWLDGYCMGFINYCAYYGFIHPFKNKEFVLTMLCLDRFNTPEVLRKQLIENCLQKEHEGTTQEE